MTEDTRKLLGDLKNTSYGKAITDYCDEKLDELGNISTATTENLKGRQEVVKFIKDFLRLIKGDKPPAPKRSYE